ncbi:SusC/RagA family TonB-linked outer membrane protein, partial [uncultured Bacteroides sp.]|uniref:SusC/RagA family TonB-linked outer membrane protein n=1 Tax=uncultured Bacteroides sp. TaxID=162156 RepID=UPI00280A9E22
MSYKKLQKIRSGRRINVLQKVSFCVCLSLFPGLAFPLEGVSSSSVSVVQQSSKKITGSVVDVEGNPVIGANVLEVGTTNGAITDLNGRFSLEVAVGAKLKISYIGFDDQIVTVGTERNIQIRLKENSEALDEVVVVGYGTQKKVNLTGSVATVKSDKLVNRTTSNVVNMLAGQMPGVTVIQNSGQPGADEGILRVRGLGTMGNSSAMVIIDGVESTMNSVNPNDIESISILKDAAASAIYGVRAANGVILITTKKGQQGRAIVSYDGYVGWQSATRMPKFLDSYNYAVLMNEAYQNDGLQPPYSEEALQKFKDGSDPDFYPNSDWLGALLSENGLFHNHYLSIKGGNDRMNYSVSFGYHDKDGLIVNTNYNKFSVRA